MIDLGTGSGCIGLSVFCEQQNNRQPIHHLYLVDQSRDALVVAQDNTDALLDEYQKSHVSLVQSDLLDEMG